MSEAVPLLPPVCCRVVVRAIYVFPFDRFIGSECDSCNSLFDDFA